MLAHAQRLMVVFAALLLATFTLPTANAAHNSIQCAAKSATVANGGTVTIDVTDCDPYGGAGAAGPVDGPAQPQNGTAVMRVASNPYRWLVDYTHNGNNATSDFFEFTDATGNGPGAETVRVTITISAPTSSITVAPGTLPTMIAGAAFSQTLTSSGGTAPYNYSVSVGALPTGLSLSSGGVLSGTPTQRGTYSFSVRSQDSASASAVKGYSGTVQNPTLSISPSAMDIARTVAFSQSIAVTGGVAPYRFNIETGTPPTGITISTAGLVSGTTNVAAASFALTLRVTDSSTPANSAYFEVENFTINVVNATPPGAPTIGTATAGNAQASVTFSAPSNTGGAPITSYTVTSNPGGFTGSGNASPIVVTGLTNGVSYTFTVTATNSAGTGSASAPSNSVTPVGPPGAPTIGAATPGDSQASIAFTAPSNNGGSAITGYTVTCNPGSVTASGAGSPVTVTGLTNGTTYTCSVTATNAAGTGPASGTVSVTPRTVPGAPTIGTASAGNGQATIAFTAPSSNGGSAITGYTVTASPGGATATGAASPIMMTGLTNGTAYTFTVTATNAAGTGAASAASNSVTPVGPPGAPTIGTASAGNGQATIAFTAPSSNGGSAITGYTVTASPGGATATGAASPITMTGLTNGTAYTFTVTATNSAGTSAPSAASNSATPFGPPGAPTIGAATPGNAQAIIAFTAPSNNGGSAITGYTVTCNPGNVSANGTASPITVTGLTNGTAYSCSVVASNAAGNSPASGTVSATPRTVPGAPTIGTATGGNAQASVSFTAPANDGGSAITSYTVTSNPGGITANGAASPITVPGLTNGTAYTFTVTATNAAGTGSPSAASNSATPATTPGAPTIGAATAGNGQASIAFTAPANSGGSAITGYTVTCNPGSVSASGAASPIVVTGLTNGTAYSCSVVATNAAGNSAPSATVSVTPRTVADAPTIGAATPGNAQATIAFTPPSNNGGNAITGYTVTCDAGGITGTGAASPITVTGLTNGTSYNCSVVATNAAGNSAPSASVAVTPRTVPDAPTIGAATPGNAQATIAFTPPANTGGSAITGYTLTCAPGGATASGAASPLTVTGLTNGTEYTCSVVATNAAGNSAASQTVAVTPSFRSFTGPSATSSGNITASFSGGGAACSYSRSVFIPLTGDPASPPAGTAPSGFTFPHGLFDFVTSGCTPGSSITLTITYPNALPPGTQYWKYGPTPTNPTPGWYIMPATISGNTAVFTIIDGGLGDDDLTANGTIVDQGGPAVPPPAVVPLPAWMLLLLSMAMAASGMRGLKGSRGSRVGRAARVA